MVNFKWFLFQIYFILVFFTVLKPNVGYAGRKYSREDILKLREEVREMFNHAYSGYLKHAYPYDELRPLSCDGVDTWGSYSLTLIDALDTLAVMGNYSEFRRVVDIVTSKANFDANINVSVFETNIRIVGGLLSAHLLSQRAGVDLEPGWPCNGPLLRLAEDVAKRLIAAFDTSTGMPYGTVNLRHGVPHGETSVTCTAGVGTFILEFGALTRLTGDPIYEEVALNALYALYHHRSSIGLYGNHIDVLTGRWTAQDSGIGAGVDSYLEYLVKGALLVQRPELMAIFNEGRAAIDKHLKRNDWYLWVSMHKGQVTLPVFQSLEAYWPGVLSLIGDISGGMKSMHNYHQVWKQYGFTPEFYNIAQGQVGTNRESYPLRPELIESTMYLYRATKDPFLLDVGMDILRSIQHSARTKCGYATIKDCRDHTLENRMESFFLAETTKYLYLLFDPDNFIHNDGQHGTVHTLPSGRECILDAGGYIFNTEAHPLDPGALMCCSDNFNEPKRYNREAARGEKFTSFAKHYHPKPANDQTAQSESSHSIQNIKEEPLDLPLAFADEEEEASEPEEFLDRLEESGAVDVVKVPPPSSEEVYSVSSDTHQRQLSLTMLNIIESRIDVTLEMPRLKPHLKDVLQRIVDYIEHSEKLVKLVKSAALKDGALEITKSHESLVLEPESKENSVVEDSNTENTFFPETFPENEVSTFEPKTKERGSSAEENAELEQSSNVITSSKPFNILSPKLVNNTPNESEKVIQEQKENSLSAPLMEILLSETNTIMQLLKKCMLNLELTQHLLDVTTDYELKSQFFNTRFEITTLARNMKQSIEELLTLAVSEKGERDVLFKKLVELVVDEKPVKDLLNSYKIYMEIVQKVIATEKLNLTSERESDKTNIQDDRSNIIEGVVNESEEISHNYGNEESSSLLQNNWKADDDDMSYQVDDRERVAPVSNVDAGPLFTDKLRLNTETVVGLLPKSLASSESPFNPQALLERIRTSPRYHRNITWTTQYELLTCLPQPYSTRIMLSGEFFSD